jgi:DNA mismatch endonuclease (patch repair protein)
MARIGSANTKPEIAVRSILHRLGYRFRLSTGKQLPGHPDIVLPKHGIAIFVHGCFWHRHKHCRFAYTPKSRVEFWTAKFAMNVRRDRLALGELHRLGWKVMVIWECDTKSPHNLRRRLERSL